MDSFTAGRAVVQPLPPIEITYKDKMVIIIETAERLPIIQLKQLMEIIINNEGKSRLKKVSSGCAVDLKPLSRSTIDELYDIVVAATANKPQGLR